MERTEIGVPSGKAEVTASGSMTVCGIVSDACVRENMWSRREKKSLNQCCGV